MQDDSVEIESPVPFQYVGATFVVSGWVPLSLFESKFGSGMDCRISVDYLALDGRVFMGTAPDVQLEDRPGREGKVYFSIMCGFNPINIGFIESSYGRVTLEISGLNNKEKIYLPIIVKQFESNKTTEPEIVARHEKVGATIKQYEQDLKYYYKEWEAFRKKREADFGQNSQEMADNETGVSDDDILNNIFWISHYGESDEKEALDKKYEKALNWRGPLATGIAGRLKGFDFRVYSDDHGKHFHVIHKERGIDARFSFPEIQLINYKNDKNLIGSKQIKAIREYFEVSKNFEKLEKEFAKRG